MSSKNILVFIVAFFYAIQFQEEPWQKDCFCGYAEKPSLYPHSSFDKSSMAANPWIVQIYNKIDVRFITIQNFVDNFLCVGSIISKKHILTSKWCFGEPLNEVDLYSHRKPRSGPNGDINAFTKLMYCTVRGAEQKSVSELCLVFFQICITNRKCNT